MTPATVSNQPAKQLLIVEDNDNARAALDEIFSYEGYRVASCSNGQEALDYLHREPLPALIILDLQMPVMNGWQFRREQKKDPELARVPVVVTTAFQSADNIDAAEIMHKPIDIEHLIDVVRRYC